MVGPLPSARPHGGCSLSRSQGTASAAAPLVRRTRAESAVLWTVLHDEAVPANSDDRIAEALFGVN